MPNELLTGKDSRPRIWITPTPQGASWSLHPRGNRRHLASPGAALDDAIAEMGIDRAVVILGGVDG